MAVFRVERNTGYTVMSNHHLRNKELTLKAKGFLNKAFVVEGQNQALTKERKFQMLGELTIREVE